MLNNFFNSIKLKNFFKSGFYLDFFLKKKINNIVKKLIKFSIFFLEKIILEYLFIKTYSKIIVFVNFYKSNFYFKKKFLYNLIKILTIFSHFFLFFL